MEKNNRNVLGFCIGMCIEPSYSNPPFPVFPGVKKRLTRTGPFLSGLARPHDLFLHKEQPDQRAQKLDNHGEVVDWMEPERIVFRQILLIVQKIGTMPVIGAEIGVDIRAALPAIVDHFCVRDVINLPAS